MAHSEDEDSIHSGSSEGEEEEPIDDPELDEEEDEEEDDEEYESSRRKRRRREDASIFFDTEAAVDEDEDEYEEEEEEDREFVDEATEASTQARDIYRLREPPRQEEMLSPEEIAKRFEERSRYQEEYYEDERPKHQGKLPTVKDPKLWMIRCKIGKEKLAVMSLMQKHFEKMKAGEPLLIKSAIAPDHLKGFIYIEALKEDHVKNATRGLRIISEAKPKLVPIKEMPDALHVAKKSVNLKRGDWIRVKRGTYSGDIGQVEDYDEGRGRVTIKIIPRLDLGRESFDKKGRKVPPKKFFNYNEMMQNGYSVDKKGAYCIWNGNKFKDGYLLKVVNIKSLDTNDVIPSLEESMKFQENRGGDQDDELEDISRITINNLKIKRKTTFLKGDIVRVIEGDLKGLMGVVDSVEGGTITVMPKHAELRDLLNIPAYQLQKYFKEGDHVKVISGRYEGETGLIVRVDNATAILLSDLSTREIQVPIDDLQECSEVTSGKIQLGGYELHQLVQINPQTVGVIVKVERDSFKILDNNGNLQTVKLQEIGSKRKAVGESFDANQNPISAGDVVKVIDGQYKDKQGTIKYVYRYFAFIHSREVIENSGIFVVRAANCALVGGSKRKKPGVVTRYPASPRNVSVPFSPGPRTPGRGPPQVSGGSGARAGFGGSYQVGRRKRDDALLNKTVVITSGQWKGYVGIVKDATDTVARVELHTKLKTVTVNKEHITLKTEGEQFRKPSWDVTKTPLREDVPSTPYRYPGTPSRPSTPIHGTAWDPTLPNTPRHQSWDYSEDSISTPGSGYQSAYPYSPLPTHQTPGTSESVTTPSTSYTPGYDTPGSGLGFGTPGSSFSERTPQDIATPSGGGGYNTPDTSFGTPGGVDTPGYAEVGTSLQDISTPGGHDAISTPGGNGLPTEEESWITTDICVRFNSGPNQNSIGVVKSIDGNQSQVEVGNNTITASIDNLSPVEPTKKNEKVKVIRGEFKGSTGVLVGIDSADGIVRMNASNEIKILILNHLALLSSQD